MRTGIFLQVRLDSQRLPRKALLPLPYGNIIQHAMRALKGIEADVYALLTDENSEGTLRPFATKEDFEMFIGPRDDVLKRYCLAARHFRVDHVIRATGDNPLVSAEMGRAILSIHIREEADLSHFIGLPLGTGGGTGSWRKTVRKDYACPKQRSVWIPRRITPGYRRFIATFTGVRLSILNLWCDG